MDKEISYKLLEALKQFILIHFSKWIEVKKEGDRLIIRLR